MKQAALRQANSERSAILKLSILALCMAALAMIWTPATLAEDDAAEPTLSDQERTQLLGLMAESKAQFLALLAGVSDAQWSFKAAPDRWSVGECAEHIVRSNESLLDAAKTALAGEPNPEWAEKTQGKAQLLLQVMPNRRPGGAGGASAPQEIRPTGELSRQQIVHRFEALYDEITEMARTIQDPLKAHTTEHPFPIFGTLNAYDWVLYVPLHTIRHSRQMVEVMEADGYPKE